MKKIIAIIQKRFGNKIEKDKNYQKKLSEMKSMFEMSHLVYKQNNILQFFQNEIIYQGILNKRAIEDAYFQAKNLMVDYYDTLDYQEKRRLLNYETQLIARNLVSRKSVDQNIYIPFFDEEMNRIYDNEMVLFDIKKYNYYVLHFEQRMENSYYYDYLFYNLDFCSAQLVYQNNKQLGFFCVINNTLYLYDNETELTYIPFESTMEKDVLKQFCEFYFNNDVKSFVSMILEYMSLRERDIKRINKLLLKASV